MSKDNFWLVYVRILSKLDIVSNLCVKYPTKSREELHVGTHLGSTISMVQNSVFHTISKHMKLKKSSESPRLSFHATTLPQFISTHLLELHSLRDFCRARERTCRDATSFKIQLDAAKLFRAKHNTVFRSIYYS